MHCWLKAQGKWGGKLYLRDEAVGAVVALQRAQDQERG